MEEGRAIGARDLILAVFRLAVADYLGVWYGHDEPAPVKRTNGTFRSHAEEFLVSYWAVYLGDLVGIQAKAVWRDTERLRLRDETARQWLANKGLCRAA
jgi:hypothetical protein